MGLLHSHWFRICPSFVSEPRSLRIIAKIRFSCSKIFHWCISRRNHACKKSNRKISFFCVKLQPGYGLGAASAGSALPLAGIERDVHYICIAFVEQKCKGETGMRETRERSEMAASLAFRLHVSLNLELSGLLWCPDAGSTERLLWLRARANVGGAHSSTEDDKALF